MCLTGSITAWPVFGLAWTAGGWLAVTATALAYRRIASAGRRTLPAAALALLGMVGSARTVETTLQIAYGQGGWWAQPTTAVSGIGLAALAWALWHAGLVHRAVGVVIACVALAGSLIGDPGAPYLLGAGPLGAALLIAAVRGRLSARRATPRNGAHARPTTGRADRAFIPRLDLRGSMS